MEIHKIEMDILSDLEVKEIVNKMGPCDKCRVQLQIDCTDSMNSSQASKNIGTRTRVLSASTVLEKSGDIRRQLQHLQNRLYVESYVYKPMETKMTLRFFNLSSQSSDLSSISLK